MYNDGSSIWWVTGFHTSHEHQQWGWVIGDTMVRPGSELELSNLSLLRKPILQTRKIKCYNCILYHKAKNKKKKKHQFILQTWSRLNKIIAYYTIRHIKQAILQTRFRLAMLASLNRVCNMACFLWWQFTQVFSDWIKWSWHISSESNSGLLINMLACYNNGSVWIPSKERINCSDQNSSGINSASEKCRPELVDSCLGR